MSVTSSGKVKRNGRPRTISKCIFAKPIEEIEDGRLQQHLYDQKFWTDDEEALRENGYEKFANDIRNEKLRFENEKIAKRN